MKKIIRKVAAVGAGSAMLLGTLGGALAAGETLADLPAPFVVDEAYNDVAFVVGALAAGADDAAGEAVIDYFGGSVVAQTTVGDGKSKDMPLNTAFNVSGEFGNTVDDDDIIEFFDTTVNIDIGSDVEYDIHEELMFNQATSPTIETGLTASSTSEDFEDNVFLSLVKDSIAYRIVFDESIDSGNFFNDSSSSNSIDLQFLGEDLTIQGATSATKITAQVGMEYTFYVGDEKLIDGKTVKLINVAEGTSPATSVWEVNGESDTISGSTTTEINDIEFSVDTTFYSDITGERMASAIIGDDAVETFTNGDPYCLHLSGDLYDDCKDGDTNQWVWYIADTATATPDIGIDFDMTVDDSDDEGYIIVGDSMSLPHDYAAISLDGFTVDDYQDYKVSVETGESLYDSTGATEMITSARVLHWEAEGASGNEAFTINTQETDDIVFYYNSTSKDLQAYYYDGSNNKYQNTGMATLVNGSTEVVAFTIDNGDTVLNVNVSSVTSPGEWNWTIYESSNDYIRLNTEIANDRFEYIGETDGDTTTTNDLKYYLAGSGSDLSGWQYDTMTEYGIILSAYENTDASDEFEFSVPADTLEVDVTISGSISSTVEDPVLVNEAAASGYANVILVGGPCVNSLTADFMDLTYPACDAESGITENKALIKLVEGTDQTALIVAGWEAADTLRAAGALGTATGTSFIVE